MAVKKKKPYPSQTGTAVQFKLDKAQVARLERYIAHWEAEHEGTKTLGMGPACKLLVMKGIGRWERDELGQLDVETEAKAAKRSKKRAS